jgi:hypothetical protein
LAQTAQSASVSVILGRGERPVLCRGVAKVVRLAVEVVSQFLRRHQPEEHGAKQ